MNKRNTCGLCAHYGNEGPCPYDEKAESVTHFSEEDYQEVKEFIESHPWANDITDWVQPIMEDFGMEESVAKAIFNRYSNEI